MGAEAREIGAAEYGDTPRKNWVGNGEMTLLSTGQARCLAAAAQQSPDASAFWSAALAVLARTAKHRVSDCDVQMSIRLAGRAMGDPS